MQDVFDTRFEKLYEQGENAKKASRFLSLAGETEKNKALEAIVSFLDSNREKWLSANLTDLENAERSGMSKAMLDRLRLDDKRIDGILDGVRQIISLPDPIGKGLGTVKRPNGLVICKRSVPLGVIAIIYEARPNVTVDSAALCLKSGNSVILRGGKEAYNSNIAATELMREALYSVGFPADCISLVQDTSHETAEALMHMDKYVDVLIPRGGANLIRSVAKNSSVPVIRTGEGICHIYVEKTADLDMAVKILLNAKTSRPSVCNAAECVLIDEEIIGELLTKAVPELKARGVELRCDRKALEIAGEAAVPAADEDWDTEYDDYILAVKTIAGIEEAVEFINMHSTSHSESIITTDYSKAQYFLDAIDSAAVYVNASTRFTDGGEFGLGAEIGISTQKLHARGPMGLDELTSYKYVIYGNGQVR